jgi:hypothetical protein
VINRLNHKRTNSLFYAILWILASGNLIFEQYSEISRDYIQERCITPAWQFTLTRSCVQHHYSDFWQLSLQPALLVLQIGSCNSPGAEQTSVQKPKI